MTRTNVIALGSRADVRVAHHLCQVRYHGKRLIGLIGNGLPVTGATDLPTDGMASLATIADALRALAAHSPSLLDDAPACSVLRVPDVGRLDRWVDDGMAMDELDSLVAWAHRALSAVPRPARRC